MIATTSVETWAETNQRLLSAAVAEVRTAVERYAAGSTSSLHPLLADATGEDPDELSVDAVDADGASALDMVVGAFGLSSFERATLVLAAAVELDGATGAACAAARGLQGWAEPTFGLALSVLPEAHWSALAPASPLRRWELIHVAGDSVTTSPLRIDERVLHFLAGVDDGQSGLDGLLVRSPQSFVLPPSQRDAAERLAFLWQRTVAVEAPVANLVGCSGPAKIAVAAEAAANLGIRLVVLDADRIPADSRELDRLARLIEREVALTGVAVFIDADEVDDPAGLRKTGRLAEGLAAPIVVATRQRLLLRDRASTVIEVARPTSEEQWRLWSDHVNDDDEVDRLVGQFDLDTGIIQSIGSSSQDSPTGWWEACRATVRPRLGALAERIEGSAGWDDLVVPDPTAQLLRQLLIDVRHRFAVYERWGMRRGRSQGLGTTAMFTGSSGTGKTLAAEVLASELELDLYRIDLSSVVSKYIGETEKNLRQVFDAAEHGGVILLFDEADALFGKRTEVRDSHDRYANTEVAYLLQRLDDYRGLAILTTNMRDAIDSAFLRRLRFVVEFPFPDPATRTALWRRAFPEATPTNDLDIDQLSQLNLTGGSIRNIATAAAFLAAAAGGAVEMEHVAQATRVECAKLDLHIGLSFAGSRP